MKADLTPEARAELRMRFGKLEVDGTAGFISKREALALLDIADDRDARCRAEVERLTKERDEAREEAAHLTDEVSELRMEPWPAWADACRKLYHEFSGTTDADFDHEFDIPEMMRDLLTEYHHAAEEEDHEARVRQQTESHKASAEHYRKMAHEHLVANSKYRRELSSERATSARMRAVLRRVASAPDLGEAADIARAALQDAPAATPTLQAAGRDELPNTVFLGKPALKFPNGGLSGTWSERPTSREVIAYARVPAPQPATEGAGHGR